MFVGGNCPLECWGRRGMKRKLNKYCEVLLCTTVTMGHWHILKTLNKVFPGQFFKAKIFPKHVCSFWIFFFYFPPIIEKLTYSQFNIWWKNRMSLGIWFNVWMLFEKGAIFHENTFFFPICVSFEKSRDIYSRTKTKAIHKNKYESFEINVNLDRLYFIMFLRGA